MPKRRFRELPVSGWFGRGQRWKRDIPEVPAAGLDDILDPLVPIGDMPRRTLKSHLVDVLRQVADSGQVRAHWTAIQYAEAKEMIQPVEIVQDHPLFSDIKFVLRSLGREFLLTHEAPEAWS